MTTFPLVQSKNFIFSSTVWGAMIGAVTNFGPIIAPLFGFDLAPADIDTVLGPAGTAMTYLGNAVAAFLVIYGRYKAGLAVSPISLWASKPVPVAVTKVRAVLD